MKRFSKRAVLLFSASLLTLPQIVIADDFFDTIDTSVTTFQEGGSYVSAVDTMINGARVTGSWWDADGDGNFDHGELVRDQVMIYRDGELKLTSESTDRESLEAWAQEHADTIMDIVFPGGIEDAAGITSDTILTQATFNKKIFQKAMTAAQAQATPSDFKGALEYQHLDINDDSGNAYSMVLGYSYEMESGLELGITLPYRYADLSDSIDTKSHYVGLDIYGKKAIMEWDDMEWSVGAEIFGSITYVSSDAIEHMGSLKYGAGIFTSFVKEFAKGALSLGLDVKISDAYLPDSLIDDNDNTYLEKAIDYVNDLDCVTTITYGINYGIPFMNDTMAVNLEVIRSNYISDDIDSDKDASTTAGIYYSYSPTDTFSLDVGVYSTFELEDVDVIGVVIGAIYRF